MAMHDQINFVVGEIRSALRFRWLGLAVAFVVCLGGWVYVARMPNVYEAQARFSLNTESLLQRALQDQIVATDQEARLAFMRQRVMTTEVLAQVALEAGLDNGAMSALERELLVSGLLRDVFFQSQEADQGSGDVIFQLRYRHTDRDKAIAVVAALQNRFYEETMGESRRDEDEALDTINQQIAVAEDELAAAEQEIVDFQRAHADSPPGALGDFQQRIQTVEENRRAAQRDLNSLRSVRAQQEATIATLPTHVPNSAAELSPNSTEARVRDLRLRREQLLVRYLETNGRVQEVDAQLAVAEQQLRSERAAMGLPTDDPQLFAMQVNPQYQQALTARGETDRQIAENEALIADLDQELAELNERRGEAYENEASLAALERRVENRQDEVDSLYATRRTLELGVTVETSNPVVFRELDPPDASTLPVEPNRLTLILGVFVAAMGACAAACYGLAQLRPIFCNAKSLQGFAELPVLGTVTNAWPASEKVRFRRSVIAFAAAASVLFVMLVGVVGIELFAESGIHALMSGG
jgi:polysaccharide chain length determinant protein (PEP-CTERM system associated)